MKTKILRIFILFILLFIPLYFGGIISDKIRGLGFSPDHYLSSSSLLETAIGAIVFDFILVFMSPVFDNKNLFYKFSFSLCIANCLLSILFPIFILLFVQENSRIHFYNVYNVYNVSLFSLPFIFAIFLRSKNKV